MERKIVLSCYNNYCPLHIIAAFGKYPIKLMKVVINISTFPSYLFGHDQI